MKIKTNILLSKLWLFVTLNYIYCDIFTLFHSEDLKNFLNGKVGEMVINQNFLLTFSIILEIPVLMILLSSILQYRINRISNISAGLVMTVVQAGSLFAGSPTKHYIFFSIIEICATLFITWKAFSWVSETKE